jgi:hypothetical protein
MTIYSLILYIYNILVMIYKIYKILEINFVF